MTIFHITESQIKKSTRLEKDTAILKKEKNDNTFNKLNTDIPDKNKSSFTKENANIHLPFTKKIETQIIGDTFIGEETVQYLTVSKKIQNNNTFGQLNIEKLVNKKSNLVQDINNRQSKKKTAKKKVHSWAGLQIVKSFLGIPNIPVK